MFSHVMVGANDIDASKRFYDAVMGALGISPGTVVGGKRVIYMAASGMFAISKPINGERASCANGGTIGFTAASPEQVNAWHEAGLANGGTTCEDPPGLRESRFGSAYAAYLRDPVGNKICASSPEQSRTASASG